MDHEVSLGFTVGHRLTVQSFGEDILLNNISTFDLTQLLKNERYAPER